LHYNFIIDANQKVTRRDLDLELFFAVTIIVLHEFNGKILDYLMARISGG